MAEKTENCKEILGVISGHDDKDGTSLSDAECTSWKNGKKPKKIAILKAFLDGVDDEVLGKITAYTEILKKNGVACDNDFTIDGFVNAVSKKLGGKAND